MTNSERIQELIQSQKISVSAFAKKIGMTQSSVDRYSKGLVKPTWEFAEAILNAYPDLSAEWLMRGKGEMFLSYANMHDKLAEAIGESRADVSYLSTDDFKAMLEEVATDAVEKVLKGRRIV